jgi:hypothetical protein
LPDPEENDYEEDIFAGMMQRLILRNSSRLSLCVRNVKKSKSCVKKNGCRISEAMTRAYLSRVRKFIGEYLPKVGATYPPCHVKRTTASKNNESIQHLLVLVLKLPYPKYHTHN